MARQRVGAANVRNRNLGAAAAQKQGGGQPRLPQADNQYLLAFQLHHGTNPRKIGARDLSIVHRPSLRANRDYRNFSVVSANSANTRERIQKRAITLDSS